MLSIRSSSRLGSSAPVLESTLACSRNRVGCKPFCGYEFSLVPVSLLRVDLYPGNP